jgi:hypothetical protein
MADVKYNGVQRGDDTRYKVNNNILRMMNANPALGIGYLIGNALGENYWGRRRAKTAQDTHNHVMNGIGADEKNGVTGVPSSAGNRGNDYYSSMNKAFDEYRNGSNGKVLYHLYGSDTYPVDTTNPENLLAVNLTNPNVEHSRTKSIQYFKLVKNTDDRGDNNNDGEDDEEKEEKEENHSMLNLPDGTLLVISTVQGTDYTSAIVRDGRINTDNLPAGHYKAYVINKKGHKHLIKRFSIEP